MPYSDGYNSGSGFDFQKLFFGIITVIILAVVGALVSHWLRPLGPIASQVGGEVVKDTGKLIVEAGTAPAKTTPPKAESAPKPVNMTIGWQGKALGVEPDDSCRADSSIRRRSILAIQNSIIRDEETRSLFKDLVGCGAFESAMTVIESVGNSLSRDAMLKELAAAAKQASAQCDKNVRFERLNPDGTTSWIIGCQ